MSETQDTTTETDAQPSRNDDGTFAPDTDAGGGAGGAGDGDTGDGQEGDQDQDRDDHLVTVTFALDNSATADVTALRDAGIAVEGTIQQSLMKQVEDILHELKQHQKYEQQQQQQQGGQRRPPER